MYVNKATTVPLGDMQQRLNPHIESMNREGWELMSVTVETIGIHEVLLLFWKKPLPPVV